MDSYMYKKITKNKYINKDWGTKRNFPQAAVRVHTTVWMHHIDAD